MGDNKQYFLAGAALGLAVYNSINVDVPFPPFMFRKLLSAAPSESSANSFTYVRQPMRYGLNDLAQYRPQLAHGLRKLLEHDGDDVETFCLYFAIDVEKYDTTVQVELCNGGESRPVTNKNRREYVDLYVHHLLDTAVARQFELFQRGFYKFCEGNAFRLFRPEEVELLIRGSDQPLDVARLRNDALYDDCHDGDPEVVWFWDVFEEAGPKAQRKLLQFITGSDRLPIKGTMGIHITLVRGAAKIRLPQSRTCLDRLYLWQYGSKKLLRTKLWTAVYGSQGFGHH